MTTFRLHNLFDPAHRSVGPVGQVGPALRAPRSELQAPRSPLRAPRSELRASGAAPRASRFTLVELLTALVVLVILMMLLFRFSGAAQDAWTKSSANMRIYQNARAALDLIEQDLNAIVLSVEPGAEIDLHAYAYTPENDGDRLTFVAATGESHASELVEVTYRKNGGLLRRREVGDTVGADWDFLGAPGGWYSSVGGAGFETVVGGVQAFSLDAFPSAVAPEYIVVTLTLRDERTRIDTLAEQSERVFTKTVFLNR